MSQAKSKPQQSNSESQVRTDAHRIGSMIRDLRKAKRLTLQQLADSIGRSLGYVSQVERGVSNLPIPVLQSISHFLGVQMTWFFQSDESAQDVEDYGHVVRSTNRKRLDYLGVGITEELLSPSLSGQLLMLLTRFSPLAATDPQQRKRCGEEAAYIKSGQLEIRLDKQEFKLNAGDSFSLKSDQSFTAYNPSTTLSTDVVWVITPPIY